MTRLSWRIVLPAALLTLIGLAGCGQRTIRIDLVPVEETLQPQVVEQDEGFFVHDRIALVPISGLIMDAKASSLLSQGDNPVSTVRETLHAIEEDPNVKAVILRINSPGGTVTASDMIYREIMVFKARTHIPVVTSMMDICASGGYYVSCASDYRFAYPTTLTGSIGVIVQTINFSGTMNMIGISAKAITSGPNKDMLSPLRPLTPNDEALAKGFVTQFYAQFLDIVKHSPQHVKSADWDMLTDGRVVTGKDAAKYGLIDQVGDLSDAIAKAKSLAGISKAQIVEYTHLDEHKGSIYAASNVPQFNMVNINVDPSALVLGGHPQFLYLWMGQ